MDSKEMKKYNRLLLLCFCFLFCGSLSAQTSNKSLYFVFIDHEPTTPVTKLCERLKSLRDDVLEIEDQMMVYLSDGMHPIVSLINMGDSGETRNTEEAFGKVISELQERVSNDVNPRVDLEEILNLFSTYNIVGEDGKLCYREVTMDFYLGPNFWSQEHHKKLLQRLYFLFQIPELEKGELMFNVFIPKGTTLSYEEGEVFGKLNAEGINKIKIKEY